jgi:O-6-methylguanine DNA methyltransferase
MHKALILLTKIPKGKVTTYGELARVTKSSPRAIGQVMRNNKHPELYPCYKVVRSDGSIGGYDGCVKGSKINKKIKLLKRDGIKIRNNRIDISHYLHRF